MIRSRIWYELCQAKHNHLYCMLLMNYQKRWLNNVNIIILAFSSEGIIGWPIWKQGILAVIACVIIAVIQILKLIQSHIVPSERQIEKLEKVVKYYTTYYNQIEQVWLDCFNNRCSEVDSQTKFYEIKKTEDDISLTTYEVIKRTNRGVKKLAGIETRNYLKQVFNV
jgi:hypothetical protein